MRNARRRARFRCARARARLQSRVPVKVSLRTAFEARDARCPAPREEREIDLSRPSLRSRFNDPGITSCRATTDAACNFKGGNGERDTLLAFLLRSPVARSRALKVGEARARAPASVANTSRSRVNRSCRCYLLVLRSLSETFPKGPGNARNFASRRRRSRERGGWRGRETSARSVR